MRARPAIFLAAWATLACAAQAQEPLRHPAWLVATERESPPPARVAEKAPDPPVATSAMPDPVTVLPLDRPVPDSVGLVAPSRVGLPEGLWRHSRIDDLAPRLARIEPPGSAPIQQLLYDMLQMTAPPPAGSAGGQAFFLVRLDALMALGRLDTARAMMERAGMQEPEIFRRWFDMTILTGDENTACGRMRDLPEITPTYPARIFCLARSGDWPAAVVTLENARALEVIDGAETERLTRFLDDLAEPGLLPPPSQPTTLDFILYEAVGEPLRTPVLPLPFAHADLRRNSGWKARVEAGERLARHGAIDADRLWGIYSERAPAASGQPWDRVAAVKALDTAIETDDAVRISEALIAAWAEMKAAGLLPMLSARVAARLSDLDLTDEAREIAGRLAALEGRNGPIPADDRLAALLRGDVPEGSATDPLGGAIVAGLSAPPPADTGALIDDGRIGEALLIAATDMQAGMNDNLDALTDGLATLRAAGRHDTAYQAAIHLLVTRSPE